MGVAKIFDKLMSFATSEFPKTEVDLAKFRSMLVYLREASVKDGTLSLEDRLYVPLSNMTVNDFPKTLAEHMEFNGKLLTSFMTRQTA